MISSRKILLALSALAIGTMAHAAEFKAGEVIVKYKDGVSRTRIQMNSFYDALGVKSVKHFHGIMEGLDQLVLKDGVKVEDAVHDLSQNGLVEWAQPNYILHALPIDVMRKKHPAPQPADPNPFPTDIPCLFPGIPFPPGCKDADPNPNPTPTDSPTPDPTTSPPSATRPELQPAPAEVSPAVADPQAAKLWGMAKISADKVWTKSRGTKNFLVADIDTGIDYNHEDLAFNVYRGKNADGTVNIGWDYVHNDGLPFDDQGHGTHTAGTIGAVGGNGVGVSGVNQHVSIMAVKFLSADGSGTTADAIRAIDYAVTNGAKVLNNSWGGYGDDDNKGLEAAIQRAEQKGVLFVVAAGNGDPNTGTAIDNDGSNPSYPAGFHDDNIISVAASDESDALTYFSNYGKKSVHLAAPGVNILSTWPGNQYKEEAGTSMACPHVAGAAALLWSEHPSWDYKKVKQVLMDTTDKLASLKDKTISGGRLNIQKALRSTD
ncbi:MAG: S8 family peptidase [Bdellovibrionota bacterium]